MSYTCKKCSYKTQQFTDMVRHVNKRKFCIKKLDAYNYTDEELLRLSLLHNIDDTQKSTIKNNKNKNVLKKEQFFEIINQIDKNKLKECPLCNSSFSKIVDLKNHLILECVTIDLDDSKIVKNIEKSIVIEGSHNSIANSNNITNNITNITNNIQEHFIDHLNKYVNIVFDITCVVCFGFGVGSGGGAGGGCILSRANVNSLTASSFPAALALLIPDCSCSGVYVAILRNKSCCCCA